MVWVNHNAAEVYRINAIEESKLVVNSHTSQQSLHHGGHADGIAHHPVDTDFFARIVSTLNHMGGILLAGPGEARFELGRYVREHRPDLAAHLSELDTPDHPGEAALVALARERFHLDGKELV
jgi:stalled ribosome rescue protein Dom34